MQSVDCSHVSYRETFIHGDIKALFPLLISTKKLIPDTIQYLLSLKYNDYGEAFPSLHWAATGRWTLHLLARNMLQCPPPTPPADLLSPAQLQPGTCYLLHVTYHMSHVTCYMFR